MASLVLLSEGQEEGEPLSLTKCTSTTASTDADADVDADREEEGPRRVSFRNDEVLGPSKPRPCCQAAKSMLELASLVQLSQEAQDFSDSEDEGEDAEDEDEGQDDHDDVKLEEPKAQAIPEEETQAESFPAAAEAEEDTDRGLELKTSKERQQRKFVVLKCLLKYQHQCQTPEQLAHIARICNRWATDAARIQAVNDYQHVYALKAATSAATAASMELTLPDMNTYPLPVKRKQPSSTPSSTTSNCSRNVRRRTDQE